MNWYCLVNTLWVQTCERHYKKTLFRWCSTTWIVWCTTWVTIESNYSPLEGVALWELALKWVLNKWFPSCHNQAITYWTPHKRPPPIALSTRQATELFGLKILPWTLALKSFVGHCLLGVCDLLSDVIMHDQISQAFPLHICILRVINTRGGYGLGIGLLLVLHLTSLATKHPLLYSITWPKSTVT